MKTIHFALVLSCFLVALCDDLTVNTKSGPVEGTLIKTALGKKVRSFLGIPYAAPPVGDLRFKAPVPVKPWSEKLEAQKKSKSCVQCVNADLRKEGFDWWIPDKEDTSEDCLTLNIWVPSPAPIGAAVMIWVHGGGYEGGTSSSDKYDGQLLATEGDVIVVSINYRHNIFGFLYLDSEEAPGNMALMDQALAFKWVKENIKSFGGDPNKVTLFGHSAGGACVSLHITNPSSQGLFQRVIAQSGTSNSIWGTSDKFSSSKFYESIAHDLGCTNNAKERKDIVDCMRKVDVDTMVEKAMESKLAANQVLKFSPVVDGSYIPVHPEQALSEKVGQGVDVMLGATTEDGLMFALLRNVLQLTDDSFMDRKTFAQFIKGYLKIDDDVVVGLIQHFYTHWENPEDLVKIRENVAHLTTDSAFLCKKNVLADLLADNGNKVFRYQFKHHPSNTGLPKWTGSLHSHELDFIFGWPLVSSNTFTKEEVDLSRKMIGYWSNFAKFGNPNGKTADSNEPVWPQYLTKGRSHLSIGVQRTVESGKELRIQECALWEKLMPLMIQNAHSSKAQCE